jgi:hypothetical protein
MARTFTAAQVHAIIEAERRGEFQLPEGDYDDVTLEAALQAIGAPAEQLLAPYLLMDDSDDSAHGTFDTLTEARCAASFDRLDKWTIYQGGQIVATYDPDR